MKTIPNSVRLFRLAGMLVVCLAVPPLLCHYVAPAVGALGASGAAVFWYFQYRFPAWSQRSGPNFWFVVSGYGVIVITLLVSLGRLIGASL